MELQLTPEIVLEAYRHGLFPMAYGGDSPYIQWVCPQMRGQLSISALHISKSLRKMLKRTPYEVRVDTDFEGVIRGCAQINETRTETWINEDIIKVFCDLHARGYAHSVECWDDENRLIGGVYGLALGGAFCGESMFSRAPNASKIALVHLVARLWKGRFSVLDTQFTNEHLEQFGVYEIPHEDYVQRLKVSLAQKADFYCVDEKSEGALLVEYLARLRSSEPRFTSY